MCEYKFVRVRLYRSFFERKPAEDYQEIVHDHARQGWRLVQIFAPGVWGYGKPRYFELIFEQAT
jgi:hypothetical protein